eukprot:Pgem_evm14s12025
MGIPVSRAYISSQNSVVFKADDTNVNEFDASIAEPKISVISTSETNNNNGLLFSASPATYEPMNLVQYLEENEKKTKGQLLLIPLQTGNPLTNSKIGVPPHTKVVIDTAYNESVKNFFDNILNNPGGASSIDERGLVEFENNTDLKKEFDFPYTAAASKAILMSKIIITSISNKPPRLIYFDDQPRDQSSDSILTYLSMFVNSIGIYSAFFSYNSSSNSLFTFTKGEMVTLRGTAFAIEFTTDTGKTGVLDCTLTGDFTIESQLPSLFNEGETTINIKSFLSKTGILKKYAMDFDSPYGWYPNEIQENINNNLQITLTHSSNTQGTFNFPIQNFTQPSNYSLAVHYQSILRFPTGKQNTWTVTFDYEPFSKSHNVENPVSGSMKFTNECSNFSPIFPDNSNHKNYFKITNLKLVVDPLPAKCTSDICAQPPPLLTTGTSYSLQSYLKNIRIRSECAQSLARNALTTASAVGNRTQGIQCNNDTCVIDRSNIYLNSNPTSAANGQGFFMTTSSFISNDNTFGVQQGTMTVQDIMLSDDYF